MSDAGQYSCAVAESPSSVSYKQFEVVVAEALLDGNDDQLKHFDKETGSSLTVGCSFNQAGGQKFFCRGECGEHEVLLQTYGEDDFKDRYRIGFRGTSEDKYKGGGILYVTITQLTESDSGPYRCSLNPAAGQGSFRDFEINVTDVVQSASPPSLTTEQPKKTSEGTTVSTDGLPSVGLTVAVIIIIVILLSVSVLIFCKKRSAKSHPVETEYDAVTETNNAVYEEIRDEGGQKGAAPVEISSVYALAKYNNTPETTDDYSVITAATPEHSVRKTLDRTKQNCNLGKAEDDSSKLTKSELNSSKADVDSPSSTSPEPQGDAGSDPSASLENPLYSTAD
ncbi:CD226 antigen isoform X2 [Haplochromis burtoni]|uniref:CD226 antigen isoform X2 n=1 Tax=Haplochromis burtoni TaxID=8153 RepID=UPI001C2DE668|nr:CD226 antigen isoform X2 [Haplochromis burtoni]